jgi:hypothetical protein
MMDRKQPIRITTSFVVLYDYAEQIEQGKTAYVFSTVQSAKDFWKLRADKPQVTPSIEKVFPRDKSHMLELINKYMGY